MSRACTSRQAIGRSASRFGCAEKKLARPFGIRKQFSCGRDVPGREKASQN